LTPRAKEFDTIIGREASAALQGLTVRSGTFDVGTNSTCYVLGLLLAHVLHALGRDTHNQATRREFLILRHQSCRRRRWSPRLYGHHSALLLPYLSGTHPLSRSRARWPCGRQRTRHALRRGSQGLRAARSHPGCWCGSRPGSAPQHHPVPEARLLPETYISNHVRPWSDPRRRGDFRAFVAVREQVAAQIQRRARSL
jgi:hypothetical protein